MREALHRVLVSFTGMPDEPLRGCTGSCSQGDQACDCEIGAWIPPDPDRVIAAPPLLPNDVRSRLMRRALLLAALALAALGALLGISDPNFTP